MYVSVRMRAKALLRLCRPPTVNADTMLCRRRHKEAGLWLCSTVADVQKVSLHPSYYHCPIFWLQNSANKQHTFSALELCAKAGCLTGTSREREREREREQKRIIHVHLHHLIALSMTLLNLLLTLLQDRVVYAHPDHLLYESYAPDVP